MEQSYEVIINKEPFKVKNDEFNVITNYEYNNLRILSNLGYYERFVSLISELSVILDVEPVLFVDEISHGGYLPIKVSKYFSKVYYNGKSEKSILSNLEHNINNYNIQNIYPISKKDYNEYINIFYLSNSEKYMINEICKYDGGNCIIIAKDSINLYQLIRSNKYEMYSISDSDMKLFIPTVMMDKLIEEFHYFIDEEANELKYDNLIHLTAIVKNGGKDFETMLINNMDIIDRWTILDTGSTDNTIDIIKRHLIGKKKGNLYKEPFINFKDTRNRCIELAGDSCKFNIMLDDTYIVKGDLRSFLNKIRGDQFSDSLSMYIKSDDVEYVSNRIIKSSNKHLRYIYKIHEVITPVNNKNVCVPIDNSHIFDLRSEYMENRTIDRKKYDLEMLFKEVEENPDDPRNYYYIAQTYNLLKEYELAFEYFIKRYENKNEGFIQEKIDSIFEAARIANFKLNKPWNLCEELYNKSYELDKSRPDSLYFIGINYKLSGDNRKAYDYIKKAFDVGYPINSQYSLKPTISYYFVPKFLAELAYEFRDFEYGLKASILFLEKVSNTDEYYNTMISWRNIYNILHNHKITNHTPREELDKPNFCIIADGGFSEWTGRDILTKGMGGSETFVVEIARYVQKSGKYNVYVFCKTSLEDNFEDVIYKPLKEMFEFMNNNRVRHCMISRFSEYIPYIYESHVENLYFILHDISPSGNVIPINKNKLRNVFCLTEWHVEYFLSFFPDFKDITKPFYYGIDIESFERVNNSEIIPYKFIYSSFPNRGLLELLEMWPEIYNKYPSSSLHLHTDIEGVWVNSVEKEKMDKIKNILREYNFRENGLNIIYHGWTNKKDLYESWSSSDVWFYPCNFAETFCLTALEAAVSKTLCISSNLAALKNTVGDRGILIDGDTSSLEWKESALYRLFSVLENKKLKDDLIEKNYNWVIKQSWENRAKYLIDEYLDKNILEYRGMYNWTNDIPSGSRNEFINILNYFNSSRKNNNTRKVLEIGAYTGTSIINILENIPNSIGIVIDKWENYYEFYSNKYEKSEILSNILENNIENIFNKNIYSKNMENRIKSIKGDSFDILLQLSKNHEKFDFIYVDGSHLCLDCFSDLILAWDLLEENGILAIDDYIFNKHDTLNSPYEAVNHFLNKYKNDYTLLIKNYRVFIIKN
jgi:predicted O-methyltransferase YrrM